LGVKTVAINAGKRGVMLMMNPKDIVRALAAKIGKLADD
jgi:prolyl-tRNA editing enzyme YbaK/EbsC (Cys-tRNA(Pro) deacylase)